MSPEEATRQRDGAERAPYSKLRWTKAGVYATPPGVSLEALEKADEITRWSGRRSSAPVRKYFVRSFSGEQPMLSRIYSGPAGQRGGRSGAVALKVLLSLLWRTASPPFTADISARVLAVLLDLPDPDGKGSRRVRDALRQLQELELIELLPRPGYPPRIRLMDERGGKKDYALPSTAYAKATIGRPKKAPAEDPNLYFKIPQELWTDGFIQTLTGPGLVMLLILLAEKANTQPVWFSTEEFARRYFVSPSTRTKGTKELEGLGLVELTTRRLPSEQGSLDAQRRRFEYRLIGVAALAVNGEGE